MTFTKKPLILGQLVTQMFKDAHRASRMIIDDDNMENVKPFPKPFSREFVLKVNVSRPYVYSQPSPQRMYCKLRPNEFRVAGAFTIDQQFMWYFEPTLVWNKIRFYTWYLCLLSMKYGEKSRFFH